MLHDPSLKRLDNRRWGMWGWEEVDEVVPKLLAILGPDAAAQTMDDFCETSGCPREKLDDWLRTEWRPDSIDGIVRLSESTGSFPLLLVRDVMRARSISSHSKSGPRRT
jgi:hypothetical protein